MDKESKELKQKIDSMDHTVKTHNKTVEDLNKTIQGLNREKVGVSWPGLEEMRGKMTIMVSGKLVWINLGHICIV